MAASYDEGQMTATDPIDRISCKPNFLGLIYPVIPEDIEKNIDKHTALTFLIHADDDRLPAENSLRFYQALRKVEVTAEIHIYARGGMGSALVSKAARLQPGLNGSKNGYKYVEILDN